MATPTSRSIFFYVDDVIEMLGVSRSKAYSIIQGLNAELKKKGKITVAGRVPRKYFFERFYADIAIPAAETNERRA